MKRWMRWSIVVLIGVGLGAAAAAAFGFALGAVTDRTVWVFGVGLTLAIGGLSLTGVAAARSGDADSRPAGIRAPAQRREGSSGGAIALTAGIAAIAFAGGLTIVLGGVERTVGVVAEVPDRLLGRVHGTWDSRMLDTDIAAMRNSFDERPLQQLVLHGDYYSVHAYAPGGEEGIDTYMVRAGDVSLWSQGLGWSSKNEFTMADVDPEIIRRSVATVYAEQPDADISIVTVNVWAEFEVSVSVTGTYTQTVRTFDARTGEETTIE